MKLRTAAVGLAVVLGASAPTSADPATVTTTVPAARPHRHAAYLELLGKGGLWGVGYDYLVWPRLAVGGTVSYYPPDREYVMSVSPYAAIYPLGGRRHRWFVQLGPQVVRLARPSPVPEWPGQSSTGVGAELSSGYELRTRVLFRAFAMGTVGKGGAAPWLGVSLGVTL